ncbi:hypothetical protein H0H92_003113 [Tricholoma furcatifolium]|nr:hypothetical protein H0H92_003113 [Tricholoma furcatifolium]
MSALFEVDSTSSTSLPIKSPNSGQKSPRRLPTDPLHAVNKLEPHKRIIVCCDGTWQDGIGEERSMYTNVLRLARTINHEDERVQPLPAIPQIVFYQSGIGSDNNLYSRYVEGTTGGSLGDKVEEAYAFIAQNYHPGDEIFLFGFSRGAYTARMVAMFIANRRDMDHFAGIFLAYQKLGSVENAEAETLRQQLRPWTKDTSPGKLRASAQQSQFTINRCLGVFDTVGSVGLPGELVPHSSEVRKMFGFHDKILGTHIEYAYQALALNEYRADFNCAKFEQTEEGRQRGQTLKQCWFTGSHSDIGGGYSDHDLADLTLTWMAAQVEHMLSLDTNSRVGIFALSNSFRRPLPTTSNDVTCETIHASVQEQDLAKSLELAAILANHPELVMPLLPLEQEVRASWPELLIKSIHDHSGPSLLSTWPEVCLLTPNDYSEMTVKDLVEHFDSPSTLSAQKSQLSLRYPARFLSFNIPMIGENAPSHHEPWHPPELEPSLDITDAPDGHISPNPTTDSPRLRSNLPRIFGKEFHESHGDRRPLLPQLDDSTYELLEISTSQTPPKTHIPIPSTVVFARNAPPLYLPDLDQFISSMPAPSFSSTANMFPPMNNISSAGKTLDDLEFNSTIAPAWRNRKTLLGIIVSIVLGVTVKSNKSIDTNHVINYLLGIERIGLDV